MRTYIYNQSTSPEQTELTTHSPDIPQPAPSHSRDHYSDKRSRHYYRDSDIPPARQDYYTRNASSSQAVTVTLPIPHDGVIDHIVNATRLRNDVVSIAVTPATPPLSSEIIPHGTPHTPLQPGITIAPVWLVTLPVTMFPRLLPNKQPPTLRADPFQAHSHPNQALTLTVGHGNLPPKIVILALTTDLIVTHLQAAPPAHYLGHNTKQPRHRHNVHPKTPLARHGAGLPVMPNPPGQRVQPVPNPTGIHVRPITSLRGTTFPNYVYAPSNPSLTLQYAEMDSALKHERDILIATTLLTNGTLSSLRRAHATSTRRSLLHDDKSIQGQLERIDLIIESSEHLQAQRDNIFLSDLDILSANLSFYCRHLLQIIDTTVTTLLDILPAYQTGSEHTSASDSNSRESLLLRIQTLIHSHGLRLESLITSANPLICELLQPQWHDASVPTHYGDLPRLIVLTQAHLLIQPSTRFLIQPFAQYNLNDFSSRIREHLPTQSLTPFDPSTIDRDDRHPINQESAGSSDTRNHSQLPSATNNDSQPLFFYRSTSNQIPQAPFLMPILSDAVLHNYHNFLWDIPILSQTHLIRNCWIIRNLCQLDHNNTDIQSLTRHHIPKRTYQIRPESSRRNPNMVSTPIRAPNVVINEPSRAVDHPPCTNPLRSDCVTPIIAQSDSTPTIVLPRTSKTQSLTAISLRTIPARAPAGSPQIRGPRRSSRIQALTIAPPPRATSNLRPRTTQPKNDCANTVYVTTENPPETIPQSSTLTEFKIILDSGATAHMFNNIAHFVTYTPCNNPNDHRVRVANGASVPVLGFGKLPGNLTVLFVPDLANNILSVDSLDQEGFSTLFAEGVAKSLSEHSKSRIKHVSHTAALI
eukprot:gene18408-18678_t